MFSFVSIHEHEIVLRRAFRNLKRNKKFQQKEKRDQFVWCDFNENKKAGSESQEKMVSFCSETNLLNLNKIKISSSQFISTHFFVQVIVKRYLLVLLRRSINLFVPFERILVSFSFTSAFFCRMSHDAEYSKQSIF